MHNHHNHTHPDAHYSKTLLVCASVNLLYVIIESGIGFAKGSAGLVGDAGHNLSDVLTLLISLAAITLAPRKPKAASALTILNALLLLGAAVVICLEGILKITDPSSVEGSVISITAGIGIIVNGLTAWLLMKDSEDDINIKASFLHMLSDTLVSVGVVVSGIVISCTGYSIIDPIISLVISAIVFVLSGKLLAEILLCGNHHQRHDHC